MELWLSHLKATTYHTILVHTERACRNRCIQALKKQEKNKQNAKNLFLKSRIFISRCEDETRAHSLFFLDFVLIIALFKHLSAPSGCFFFRFFQFCLCVFSQFACSCFHSVRYGMFSSWKVQQKCRVDKCCVAYKHILDMKHFSTHGLQPTHSRTPTRNVCLSEPNRYAAIQFLNFHIVLFCSTIWGLFTSFLRSECYFYFIQFFFFFLFTLRVECNDLIYDYFALMKR